MTAREKMTFAKNFPHLTLKLMSFMIILHFNFYPPKRYSLGIHFMSQYRHELSKMQHMTQK